MFTNRASVSNSWDHGQLEGVHGTGREGTPPRRPLSPLLANLLLSDLDKELEKQGPPVLSCTLDDCNIYVQSKRRGTGHDSVTQFLEQTQSFG